MIGIAAIMCDATAQFEELRALRRQLTHRAINRMAKWPAVIASATNFPLPGKCAT
jgi:hypothetical protein